MYLFIILIVALIYWELSNEHHIFCITNSQVDTEFNESVAYQSHTAQALYMYINLPWWPIGSLPLPLPLLFLCDSTYNVALVPWCYPHAACITSRP